MRLTLSPDDLTQTDGALRTLLSPLDHVSPDHWRAAVLRMLDELAEGFLVCSATGRVLHRNRAFDRAVRADSDGERLRREVDDIVRTLAGVALDDPRGLAAEPPTVRTLHTSAALYRMAGSYLAHNVFCPGPAIMVGVEHVARAAPRRAEPWTESRFGLTRREVDVTYLLAQGRSNADIAAALSISAHTARHHTESVLGKLGVRSRAQVAAMVSASGR